MPGIDGARWIGPRARSKSRGPGDEEERRDHDDPGEERDPQPDALHEEVERQPARPRPRPGSPRTGRPGRRCEPVRLAARITARNIPSLARGSMRWSRPAWRACCSVKTACSIEPAIPPTRRLEPADPGRPVAAACRPSRRPGVGRVGRDVAHARPPLGCSPIDEPPTPSRRRSRRRAPMRRIPRIPAIS